MLEDGQPALVPVETRLVEIRVIIPGGAVPYVVRSYDSGDYKFIGEW
jgi:hypothetical protein